MKQRRAVAAMHLALHLPQDTFVEQRGNINCHRVQIALMSSQNVTTSLQSDNIDPEPAPGVALEDRSDLVCNAKQRKTVGLFDQIKGRRLLPGWKGHPANHRYQRCPDLDEVESSLGRSVLKLASELHC